MPRKHPPPPERRTRPRRAPRRDAIASPESQDVYRRVMQALRAGGVDFLVGGAYAFTRYTGIDRDTKDFDLFVRKTEVQKALDTLSGAGFRTELTFPHWLGKAHEGKDFVDIIFSSGNGVAVVDDGWFAHAEPAEVLGEAVRLCPPEEMLWSKAFVMERERYDGADVIHLLRSGADTLDWPRLVARFGARWRVLLMNLVLFGFVYPGERSRIPAAVMQELLGRLQGELATNDDTVGRLCNGTVVSRQQYLIDTQDWGYVDGRLAPRGGMSAEEIAHWTWAIGRIK